MPEKRKDSRGRILRHGESQRSNGQYIYQYVDADGKRKTIYSWTLVPSDRTPAGKRPGESLREKVQVIERNLSNGFISQSTITVGELVTEYITTYKSDVKQSSLHNFERCINVVSGSPIWSKKITAVGKLEAKKYVFSLYENHGETTVMRVRNVLRACFNQAVEDEIVSKNPFDFKLPDRKTYIERDAVPSELMETLLDFTSHGKRYRLSYVIMSLLLETGLRISELLGLRICDIDAKGGTISVDHQLLHNARRSCGKVGYYIETTKTESGKRMIPISRRARESLALALEMREVRLEKLDAAGISQPSVDGYTDFIFFTGRGTPMSDVSVRDSIHRACAACESKTGVKLPNVTPHVIRHTFCTRLVNSGVNPKSVQYLMGHRNVDTTLNVYSHTDSTVAMQDMMRSFDVKTE